MDSALRTISYIADIGSIVVLMARRRISQATPEDFSEPSDSANEEKSQYRMICYVFESEDVSICCFNKLHTIQFLFSCCFCSHSSHCDLSHFLAVINWDSFSAE